MTYHCFPAPRWWAAAFAGLLLAAGGAASGPAQATEVPAWGVATPHPLATGIAEDVLSAGGNAFDAAVAVSAALGVVEPYGSGLGGGGFWLLHEAASGHDVMIDARERAPLAASADMFLDASGEADSSAALDGPLAAAIPGQPAALAHVADRFGQMPLADLLQPAIGLAREGFAVDERYEMLAGFRAEVLGEWGDAATVFLDDGDVPEKGHTIRQPELADTLERLAREGRKGFYEGVIAERMVEAVRAAGGIWSPEDLRAYEVVERDPITAEYHGMRLVSAPPPSSGGIALAQMLAMLAGFDLAGAEEGERIHLMVEAMRRAYHDRARYLGDTDFADVPVDRLIHPAYAAGLAASIRHDRATPSEVFPGPGHADGGRNTTHFSIIDGDGNRVAATLSLNYPFGSGFMPPGTGVVLNNHMDDFAIEPGTPNVYGLVQGEANRIEPGKRMLSSMSPTFLEHEGRVAVTGTPGASRIINAVLLAALDFHAGVDAGGMVEPARFHHQYLPDVIQYEPGAFDADLRARLKARGHELEEFNRTWGNSQAVVTAADGALSAAADPRGLGTASARGRVGSR